MSHDKLYIKYFMYNLFFRGFNSICSDLESKIKSKLDGSAQDLGLVIRGVTITSNFCPTAPIVYNFILYVQHPGGEDYDNFNTHGAPA